MAKYLIANEHFIQISLVTDSSSAGQAKQDSLNPQHLTFQHAFTSAEALLAYVTKRWNQRWIITCVETEYFLEKLRRRPFFLLVYVDAPVSLRWKRLIHRWVSEVYRATFTNCPRNEVEGTEPPHLTEFVTDDDARFYSHQDPLFKIVSQAKVHLLNASSTVDDLYESLREMDLTDDQRLRPNWDTYFMQLASLAAQRSNCMKRRVGCVLVRDKRVISTGYNGTPRNIKNCNEGGCTSIS